LLFSQHSVLETAQKAEKSFGGPILSNSATALAMAAFSSSGKPEIFPSEEENIQGFSFTANNSALLGPNRQIANAKNSDSSDYFIIPTTGWNWGQLHSYNAVDIADNCGTPIYAAAEGLVVESASKGWNNGYGQYIKIEHPNGSETLYSHFEQNVAAAGKYVFQGELIGYMGNTGNTHGPTGCHLHFEVRGAKNPLAK
jgi:murein DD-endopeptidase MepM/ murein hydrolase activator NlpD